MSFCFVSRYCMRVRLLESRSAWQCRNAYTVCARRYTASAPVSLVALREVTTTTAMQIVVGQYVMSAAIVAQSTGKAVHLTRRRVLLGIDLAWVCGVTSWS